MCKLFNTYEICPSCQGVHQRNYRWVTCMSPRLPGRAHCSNPDLVSQEEHLVSTSGLYFTFCKECRKSPLRAAWKAWRMRKQLED